MKEPVEIWKIITCANVNLDMKAPTVKKVDKYNLHEIKIRVLLDYFFNFA